jgi:hypothetical protein
MGERREQYAFGSGCFLFQAPANTLRQMPANPASSENLW